MNLAVVLVVSVFLVSDGAVPRVLTVDEDGLPVVQTGVGAVRGLRADDGDYSMFMGIPYAQIDPDNLFGDAKPHPYFETTYDAFDDSTICPQREEFNNTIVGSLDCLHVNIYVPDSASDLNRLPVYVYIYGGGFSIGFAGRYLYGPSFLVRHDIILVTLNYRLGPYGFMCLDIPEVPGNQGLKDQVAALRWIRDNIEAFGGDSSRITIGGNSAGGMSADYHLYYGPEENLYHRVIPQSGVALLSLPRFGNPSAEVPFHLAELFNYTSSDVKDALAFLATVDPHELITAVEELGTFSFGPCIENKFDDVENFITDLPINIGVPKVKDVDVLIGFNNDEAYHGFAIIPDIVFRLIDFVEISIAACFDFENEAELFAEMRKIVTNFYFGDEDITAELRQEVSDMTGDFIFVHPVLRTVKKYLDYGAQNLYLYKFSYSGGRNFAKDMLNVTEGGACHADELGYLFDVSYMEKPLDPEDQLIVDRMTEMWANFVKYGNPTPELTELVPVLWQPVSQEQWHYLELDSTVRVSTRPFHQRMAFLDLFYKANEEYQRGFNREPEAEEPAPGETDPDEETGQPGSASNMVLDISLPVLMILAYFRQLWY